MATGKPCPIVYDSTLSTVPPDLDPTPDMTVDDDHHLSSLACTEIATAGTCRQLIDDLKREHQLIRDMLSSGYKSLVILPQLVQGWKDTGSVYGITMQDEDTIAGLPRFRGNSTLSCKPRES